MTTINALKNLYVELGGNIKDVENITIIPEMIDALSAIAGSTIELPAVSSTDNGDVLTVVDGKWDKAEAGGGSSLPDVTADDNGEVLMVTDGAWAKGYTSGAKVYNIQYNSNRYDLPSGVKSKDIYAECESGVNVILKSSSGLLYKYIGINAGYHVFNLVYEELASSKVYVETIWAENNESTYLHTNKSQIAKAQ